MAMFSPARFLKDYMSPTEFESFLANTPAYVMFTIELVVKFWSSGLFFLGSLGFYLYFSNNDFVYILIIFQQINSILWHIMAIQSGMASAPKGNMFWILIGVIAGVSAAIGLA